MNHKELVDHVSASLIKKSGKLESRKSWLAMRNYLEQNIKEELFSFNLNLLLKYIFKK